MAPEINTDPTNPWLGQPAMPEEEHQPLTLGQRIAAKAKPAPVMPAQPEPPPDVKPTFDPKLMPSGVLAGITTQVPQPESAPDAHSVGCSIADVEVEGQSSYSGDDVEVAPPKQYLDRRLTLSMKENI